MVAKGTKRKANEGDAVAEKCDTLLKVITDAASLPADVVKMLADVMPHSLGQPKDKRHRYQEEALLGVDRLMQGIEETLKNTIEECRAQLVEAKRAATPSEAAVEEADKQFREASERFDRETKALANITMKFRAARAAVQAAEESQLNGNEDFKEASKRKAKLQGIINDIELLKKGDVVEADVVDKRCKSVLAACKQLDLDEAILLVLDSALKKAPSERGEFDDMAIDQLDKYMAKRVEPLDEVINAGEAGRQQRAAAVESARGTFEEALKAQKLVAESFEAELNEKKHGERLLEASREAVKDLAARTKSCDKAVYRAEAESDVFQEFARKAFEELKDRSTPKTMESETSENVTEDMQPEASVILPEALTA